MGITTTTTYACDFTGCTTTFTGTVDAASTAGWTWTAQSYALNAYPSATIRCPAHAGQ